MTSEEAFKLVDAYSEAVAAGATGWTRDARIAGALSAVVVSLLTANTPSEIEVYMRRCIAEGSLGPPEEGLGPPEGGS